MATNLKPFCSKRLMISPKRPRCTPSGLIMMKVRSWLAMVSVRLAQKWETRNCHTSARFRCRIESEASKKSVALTSSWADWLASQDRESQAIGSVITPRRFVPCQSPWPVSPENGAIHAEDRVWTSMRTAQIAVTTWDRHKATTFKADSKLCEQANFG